MASVEVIDLTADSPISDRALDVPPLTPQGQLNDPPLLRFDSPASGSSPIVLGRQLSSPPIVAFRASRPPVAGPSRTRRRTRSPSPDSDIEIVEEGGGVDEVTRMRNRMARGERMMRAGILEVRRIPRQPPADDGDDVAVDGDPPMADDYNEPMRVVRVPLRGDWPPPRQRRRIDPEVIDVDDFMDLLPQPGRANVQSPPPPQRQPRPAPRLRRSQVRDILGLGGVEAEARRQHRNHPGRRALFSPDPPPPDDYIPPVPRLPIFPDFGVRRPLPPPPQPQPPRRLPVMNLGGAMLTRGLFNNFFGIGAPVGPAVLPPPQPAAFGSLAGVAWGLAGFEAPRVGFWAPAAPIPQPPPPANPALPEYQREMTHPKRWAGCTFDFAPSPWTNASSSTSASKKPPAFACVSCRRPLIINAEGDRKIWALRCGHMLDARCIAQLCKPPVKTLTLLLDEEAERMAAAAAAAGSVDDPGFPKDLLGVGNKGKGKQRAMSAAVTEIELTGTPDGGIRSRLRSSRHPAAPTSPVQAHTHPDAAGPSINAIDPPPATTTTGNTSRRKGKGRGKGAQQGLTQEEYEWYCPFPRCGRLHTSVRVMPQLAGKGKGKARASHAKLGTGGEEAVWKAGGPGGHKERGAIPVFV